MNKDLANLLHGINPRKLYLGTDIILLGTKKSLSIMSYNARSGPEQHSLLEKI